MKLELSHVVTILIFVVTLAVASRDKNEANIINKLDKIETHVSDIKTNVYEMDRKFDARVDSLEIKLIKNMNR